MTGEMRHLLVGLIWLDSRGREKKKQRRSAKQYLPEKIFPGGKKNRRSQKQYLPEKIFRAVVKQNAE